MFESLIVVLFIAVSFATIKHAPRYILIRRLTRTYMACNNFKLWEDESKKLLLDKKYSHKNVIKMIDEVHNENDYTHGRFYDHSKDSSRIKLK